MSMSKRFGYDKDNAESNDEMNDLHYVEDSTEKEIC